MENIFVTSLHRSATQSIHTMFEESGLSSLHWPSIVDGVDIQSQIIGRETDHAFIADCMKPCIDKYTAISDVPIPAIYEELYYRYPKSIFITIERNVDDWIASVRKHIKNRQFDPFEKTLYWKYIEKKENHINCISDAEMRNMFFLHHKNIKEFFSLNQNYLHVKLDNKDIGNIICRFLGIIQRSLPHRDYLLDSSNSENI